MAAISRNYISATNFLSPSSPTYCPSYAFNIIRKQCQILHLWDKPNTEKLTRPSNSVVRLQNDLPKVAKYIIGQQPDLGNI